MILIKDKDAFTASQFLEYTDLGFLLQVDASQAQK